MKPIAALAAVALVAGAHAQNPNVVVKFDGIFQVRGGRDIPTRFKSYDLLGRHSVVTLGFSLEPGFDVVVSQRLQQILDEDDTDAPDDWLDEYYIEDRGYWRLGKQYIPFGRGQILRETVYSGTLNTTAGARALPLTVCLVNGEPDRQRGVTARLGGKIGLSYASGRHFGSSPTALTVVRRPEEAPGPGRGFEHVIGVDYATGFRNNLTLSAEHARFREGDEPADRDMDVTDLQLTYKAPNGAVATLGVSREWQSDQTFVRATAQAKIRPGLFVEPIVRVRNGVLWDWGIGLRIKP